jgi:alpha,alpha-trehalase
VHVAGAVPQGGSPFPPIAAYAFLSDCEACALVAPDSNIEWMCLPRPDSDSVFGAMLDRDAGNFRLAPVRTSVPAGRRYVPGTMVLETTWSTPTGWVVVHDALLVGPWHHYDERSATHRRTPPDTDADHVLLRTVECVNGRVEMLMECEPRPGYGVRPVGWSYDGPGYGAATALAGRDDPRLRLTTDLRLGFEGGRARARTTLRTGDRAYVALTWTEHRGPADGIDARRRLRFTEEYWREWLSHGAFPDHPWRTYLERSALALKGLTYAPTGALTAAATTSLPETPGGVRNWDYRYSWVRDSTFMLWALYTLGIGEEADDFFYFIRGAAGADARLQVMYGVGGERELPERELQQLSGYAGARPVRVGNHAYRQRQHDVWGALLDSIYLHTRNREGLAESTWRLLCAAVEECIGAWRLPDRGIWEMRGEPRHYVSSKVMCWVACDRGARLARLREDFGRAERWLQVAGEIHAEVLERGVDRRGVFRQHYDTDALDASNLLIALVRFLPADDPRLAATVDAILTELGDHGFVLRYRVCETDDGLVGGEGAFFPCGFWAVSALVEIGEPERARELCEKLLCAASPLELFAEEIEPLSGRHLGNFPQGLSHLALINAVMHVIRADEALSAGQPLSSISVAGGRE